MIDTNLHPRLPYDALTPEQLADAATYWQSWADADSDEDIAWTREMGFDDLADSMERSREACRQEAIVCDALAHFDTSLPGPSR